MGGARTLFSLSIVLFAAMYTVYAFELEMTSSAGSLGPGFFPRILGLVFVGLALYSLWRDRAEAVAGKGDNGDQEATSGGHWRATVFVAGLSSLFVAVLTLLGGLLAMIGFTFAALAVLNRGRWITNVAVSLSLPVALYLLFETFLNAAMPEGIVPLPL